MAQLPTLNLVEPVERYFEYVQGSVDLNRDLATKWAELVTLDDRHRSRPGREGQQIVKEQTDPVADVATDQAKKGEEVAQEQAEARREGREGAGSGWPVRPSAPRPRRPTPRPASPTRS